MDKEIPRVKIINQSFEYWGPCGHDREATLRRIELCGRVCYKSGARIGEGTAEKFVTSILKHDPPHLSVFEHSNIVVRRSVSDLSYKALLNAMSTFNSRYMNIEMADGSVTIWGNLRAWAESLDIAPVDVWDWLQENGYEVVVDPTLDKQRITVLVVTDRAVLAEITRHRNDVAFSVESQRYVRYDGGMQFIFPSWFNQMTDEERSVFISSCEETETLYNFYRQLGRSPQESRVVLTNQVAVQMAITAYVPQWQWMFKLRTASGAYPQMIQLMSGIEAKFTEEGLV